ncbi:hypothetical protein CVS47_01856 [Microbacterium lemovicicum]|uniref:Histidinol dehydrogenase n=1 Tax=Microbacterium lemovicicum TaxID=1072463 RepID=A0A3Q9IZ48_9MICO|nr:histidinol dehydrogenase [Microbacterium lemovicicum]AZS37224.1 hypothetical protein CVS47_01856 [Microbacterium lemovicicum]
MSSLWPRLVTWVIALVVGVVYGLAGTIAQSFSVGVLPVGLVLAIIGSAALLAAVRLLTGDRWSTLLVGLGIMTATLVFSGAGPGGSVIVPQPPEGTIGTGIIWTIAVPVLVAVVVAWPDLSAARDSGAPSAARSEDARPN